MLKGFIVLSHLNLSKTLKVDTNILLILKIRKSRHREIKKLASFVKKENKSKNLRYYSSHKNNYEPEIFME